MISSSVADTAPVFEKILDSCRRLFATEQLAVMLLREDGRVHPAAWRGSAFDGLARKLAHCPSRLRSRGRRSANVAPSTHNRGSTPSRSPTRACANWPNLWAPIRRSTVR